MRFHLLALLFILYLTSCTKDVIVQFHGKPPQTHASEPLNQLINSNKSPKIVLRTLDSRHAGADKLLPATQVGSRRNMDRSMVVDNKSANALRYDYELLYSAIEKQLFIEGFKVRDRALFNDVITKADQPDYSKFASLTDTDLILDIIHINPMIKYDVDTCYKQKSSRRKAIALYDNKSLNGASIEFKLIHIKLNEVVGTYKYHYVPCKQGCTYVFQKGHLLSDNDEPETDGNAVLTQDQLEQFLADATTEFVKSMR